MCVCMLARACTSECVCAWVCIRHLFTILSIVYSIPFNFDLTDASEKTFRSLLSQIPQLNVLVYALTCALQRCVNTIIYVVLPSSVSFRALGGCGLNFAYVYLMQLEFGEKLDTVSHFSVVIVVNCH